MEKLPFPKELTQQAVKQGELGGSERGFKGDLGLKKRDFVQPIRQGGFLADLGVRLRVALLKRGRVKWIVDVCGPKKGEWVVSLGTLKINWK